MVEEEKEKIPIPKKLREDVKKMDRHTIKRTILTNQKLLKKARLEKEERQHIKNMLSYLKSEYKKKKKLIETASKGPSKMAYGGMSGGKKHMYTAGGNVTDNLPNKGTRALAKTPKGRKALKNMGFDV